MPKAQRDEEEEPMSTVERILQIKEEQTLLERKIQEEEAVDNFTAKCKSWLQMADERLARI